MGRYDRRKAGANDARRMVAESVVRQQTSPHGNVPRFDKQDLGALSGDPFGGQILLVDDTGMVVDGDVFDVNRVMPMPPIRVMIENLGEPIHIADSGQADSINSSSPSSPSNLSASILADLAGKAAKTR